MLESKKIKRRSVIKTLGAVTLSTPLLGLSGCGGGSGASSIGSVQNTVSGSSAVPSGSNTSTANNSDWASGGTNSITTTFPPADPMAGNLGSICSVTRSYTLGPCYFSPDEYRQDISEGEKGVPMILVLKLVDQSCNPIENADIDIWHCNSEGVYSASTLGSSNTNSFNSGFCSGNDANALASRWFRGVQVTNIDGLVFFKSCFPGWYRGRTPHIHFKVIHNNVQSLVSQFCIEDSLSGTIYLSHPDYTGISHDTTNAADSVFGSDFVDCQLQTVRNNDGSMLAYKTIQISI